MDEKLSFKLQRILPKDVKVLCELFGRLIFFDSGKKEFWWLPKFQRTTKNTYRIGWMYWAFGVMNVKTLMK